MNAVLHLDEQTPHIHATVVPIDAAGKLNCRAMLGDRQKMRSMQTSFAAQLAPLGLQRGVEGSQAQDQEVKRFYGLVKELNPQLEQEAQRQRATRSTSTSSTGWAARSRTCSTWWPTCSAAASG
ncbi:plasmid recombination protein [Hymenobacter sp. BT664]|uniref:Plasmid recombination protein n=1 Tax=Hymenobacter montanus TaxID=2771359 RepID=A0A927BAF3_9BACT|nr:plasmid recombination protein [Hymenobacter montanus]